ncbi:hypothetical protein J4227_07605 [Candidatus Woesearchaeota archaeon]|nr:hypothetical protein [Candidatus Woesearchaeota archaeon]
MKGTNSILPSIIILSVVLLILSGCAPLPTNDVKGCAPVARPAEDVTVPIGGEPATGETPAGTETPAETVPEEQPVTEVTGEVPVTEPILPIASDEDSELIMVDDGIPTKYVVEGQTVQLDLRAIDPDGDPLSYTFSPPMDSTGKWKTHEGDVGTYFVSVTADDGESQTTQKVRIIVRPSNKPPIMGEINDVMIEEGSTIILKPLVVDPENDDITMSYSGWMATDTYITTFNDAGEHFVTITANDGKNTVSQEVRIVVTNVNRPPVLGNMADMVAVEGDAVRIVYYAADLDKDPLTFSFSKPFNALGEWQTGYEDEGEYPVIVSVSDGELTDEKAFKLTVYKKNRAPAITGVEDIIVKEGELVQFSPIATDPDGDQVYVSYKGWMSSASYTTNYNDAGSHDVYIIASDGTDAAIIMRTVTVENVNRPPVFQIE